MRNFLDFAGIASISFGRLSGDSAKKREKPFAFFLRLRYNIYIERQKGDKIK